MLTWWPLFINSSARRSLKEASPPRNGWAGPMMIIFLGSSVTNDDFGTKEFDDMVIW